MKLINKTKNKVISENMIIREKPWELMMGLIPYKVKNKYIYDYLKFKRFKKEDAMLFKVRFNDVIHTWFMSFPIAVFFLDDDMRVIEKVRLKPFKVYLTRKRFRYFLEVVELKFDEIELGDELELI